MAFQVGQISATVTANTAPFMNAIGRAHKRGNVFSKSMQRKLNAVSQTMVATGAAMSKGLTAPIVAGMGLATREFGNFNQAMTESTAIMGDVSTQTRKEMRKTAKSISTELGVSAQEAAESYFFLASAGLDAQQSIEALPQVAKFAQAGMFSMKEATDLATDAQSALGLTAKDSAKNLRNLERVTDVLVKANTLANASVQQFSESLTNRAAAALRSVNKELEEGVSVLAAFADQGMKGQRAGEFLARIIRRLSAAAAENTEAFKRMGLLTPEGNLESFANIIQIMTQQLDGLSDAQKSARLEQLGFTARVQAAIKPLLGMSDQIREYEQNLKGAGGTTEEVADKQLQSFNEQMGIVLDQIRNAAIDIGQKLAPEVKDLAKDFGDLATAISNMDQKMLSDLITFVKGMAAAGPALFLIGKLTGAIAALGGAVAAGPWIGAGAAAGGLIGWMIAGQDEGAKLNKTLKQSEKQVKNTAKGFRDIIKEMKAHAKASGKSAKANDEFVDTFSDIKSQVTEQYEELNDRAQDLRKRQMELNRAMENASTPAEYSDAKNELAKVEQELQSVTTRIETLNPLMVDLEEGWSAFGDSADDADTQMEEAGSSMDDIIKKASELQLLMREQNMGQIGMGMEVQPEGPDVESKMKDQDVGVTLPMEFDSEEQRAMAETALMTARNVGEEIKNMEIQSFGEKMFPPGSIGFLQQKLQHLKTQYRQATDPERQNELKNKIKQTGKEIDKMKGKMVAARVIGQKFGNALANAALHGESLLDSLKKMAKQLAARAITQFVTMLIAGPGAGSALGSALFGGIFHEGGVVPGSGEKMAMVEGGEAIFTPDQLKALNKQSAPSGGQVRVESGNEKKMERAFGRAMDQKLQKLGPEEVYVMNRKGREGF